MEIYIKQKIVRALFLLLVCFVIGGLPQARITAAANNLPIGYFDVANYNGFTGWACDQNDYSKSLTINFYADGESGKGMFIGSTVANLTREAIVSGLCGGIAAHGFSLAVPAGLVNDNVGHSIYAYAVDFPGDAEISLTNSPKPFGDVVNGNSQISSLFDGAPLILKTCDRIAGAVCSIIWKGKEFVEAISHGSDLQSCSTFDNIGECFNPTEAGTRDDGIKTKSTSVVRSLTAIGNVLNAKSQMAFWLQPGQVDTIAGNCGISTSNMAVNKTALSNHMLDKKITLGFNGIPNVIEYLSNFTVAEAHSVGQFEAPTGYMPAEFNKFWTYNPETKTLAPLSDGPGEQSLPEIFSTSDENFAMGIYSPDQPQTPGWGYGRWNLGGTGEPAVKWNCVFRTGQIGAKQIFSFRTYMIIGSLKEVAASMDQLRNYFATNEDFKPKGFFDGADCDKFAGWSCDQNDYSKNLTVNFYADGPAGQGTFIGSTVSGLARESAVADFCGGYSNHGFLFTTPANLQDGKPHTIYAYDGNIPSGTNVQLINGVGTSNSKIIQCAVISTCTNQCASGATQCSDNGVQTCAFIGGCLKWGVAAACGVGQACNGGVCVSACAAKTCATLGNYQCGSWNDGCGATINCGSCSVGKVCSNGSCVANCSSHASKQCDSGKLYWYSSCGVKEELAQSCGTDVVTQNYQCSGNWIQRETIKKGCDNNLCYSISVWNNATNCSLSNKVCQNKVCSAPTAVCANECSLGAKQCVGNGVQTCGNYDADSCLEWSGTSTCAVNQSCKSGVCVTNNNNNQTCTNECQIRGTRQCAENGYQICGNYDSDSCLEWSITTACNSMQRCSIGACHVDQAALRARIAEIQKLIQELMRQLAALRVGK